MENKAKFSIIGMRLIFMFLCIFTLYGCTITTSFYIINKAESRIKIELHINPDLKNQYGEYILKSDKFLNQEVKYFTYEKLEIEDIPIISTELKITTFLNPNQILFIGTGQNSNLRKIENIYIENKHKYSMERKDKINKFKYHNSGFLKTVGIMIFP